MKKIIYKPPQTNATEEEKEFAKSIADMLIGLVDLGDEEDDETESEGKDNEDN